ncbi:MAG: bacteriocin immunity protein [Treponema sp.]|nr:bacteriocin immunity protein [Treponema sp.]
MLDALFINNPDEKQKIREMLLGLVEALENHEDVESVSHDLYIYICSNILNLNLSKLET